MITDPIRACELLVGLPDVVVLGVVEASPFLVYVELRGGAPACVYCGTRACEPRLGVTDRAGRLVTEQVGRCGRTVNEVAVELGCDWHTDNDTVMAYGAELVDDPDRIGKPTAIGLDETLFFRLGRWRSQQWSTSTVDVGTGRLLDVVPGRGSYNPCRWLAARDEAWLERICSATLDLSGPYRSVFDTMLPDATQVADPFHVCKLANTKLDECRRRVQNETMGHRGRKSDPLYRSRRLLTRADERLDDRGRSKLMGLLDAGDPAARWAPPTWPINRPSVTRHGEVSGSASADSRRRCRSMLSTTR